MTNPDVHGGAGEQIAQPLPDLAFAEPGAIDKLRTYHRDWINGVRELEVGLLPNDADDAAKEEARQRADGRVVAMVDGEYDAHVARGTEDVPQGLHDRIAALLSQFSYRQMSDEEWGQGSTDADGNRQPSGRERLQGSIDAIRTELASPYHPDDPPEDPPEPSPTDTLPTQERLNELNDILDDARQTLAELSIKRRQLIRKGGQKAQQLEDEYADAKSAYYEANKNFGIAQARRWRAGVEDDGTTSHPMDDTAIQAGVIEGLLREHRAFSMAEYDALEADGSRRAQFARWVAGKRLFTPLNIASGVALGYGAKWVQRGALGATVGVATPAALAAGLAIKTTRTAFAASVGNKVDTYRHFDKRHLEDHKLLQEQADATQHEHTGGTGADNHETLIDKAHGALQGIIDQRVERDRKHNRNRVAIAALGGAAAGALGVGLEYGLEHAHVIGGLGSHGHGGSGSGSPSHPAPGGGSHGGSPSTPGAPHPTPPPHPGTPGNPGETFSSVVNVTQGEGYEQVVTNLAAQHNVHLSGAQADQLWHYLLSNNHAVQNGNFFADNHSIVMNDPGHFGIGRTGISHINPHVLNGVQEWLKQNDIAKAAAKKAAKKAGKAATASVLQSGIFTATGTAA